MEDNAAKVLFAMGGAHPDRRCRVNGIYVPGASNPGVMDETVGGGVFNAARTAARCGYAVQLLSARGGDSGASLVEAAMAEAGIDDLSGIFLDRRTPSYTSLLDRTGEQIAGFADMALYELAFVRLLRRKSIRTALKNADAVLADANPAREALEALAAATGDKPLFAIAVSPAKVVRLAGLLPRLACLFMNKAEAVALASACQDGTGGSPADVLTGAGLGRAVITAGSGPLTLLDEGRSELLVPPPAEHPRDVTGAGDALAGATVAALMRGTPFRDAVLHGMAAAAATVETEDSVAPPGRLAHYLDLARRMNPS